MTIKELLIQNFNNKTFSGKTAKQIFISLGITKAKDKDAMRKIFDELEKENVIGRVEGKFYSFEDCGYIKGTIKTHERGFAFFTPQDKTLGELFIPSRSLNGAFQGDTVLAVKVVGKRGSTDEGEIVKVLERGKPQLVGTFYAERTYGFVVPDDRGFTKDIFIAGKNSQNAKTGSKVVCNIISYSDGKSPEGEIVEVLGSGSDIATEESVAQFRGLAGHEIGKNGNDALAAHGKHRNDLIIVARIDVQLITDQSCSFYDFGKIAVCFLDGRDVGNIGKRLIGRRLNVDTRAGGDVVKDDRLGASLCNRLVHTNKTLLRCLVVVRGDNQGSICTNLAGIASQLNGIVRVVGSGAGDDGNSLCRAFHSETDCLAVLLVS